MKKEGPGLEAKRESHHVIVNGAEAERGEEMEIDTPVVEE